MLAINDLSGYATVFLPGEAPTFIVKSASSPPQLISVREKYIRSTTRLRRRTSELGFAFIDHKVNFENDRYSFD